MSGIERTDTPEDSRLFDDTKGFFRVRTSVDIAAQLDTLTQAGPPLDDAQAHALTRRFVDVLAEGRPVEVEVADTVDYAERNNLVLLFSPEDAARFARLYPRMSPELVERWRKALRGGDPRDSFGPLTAEERLDERRIEADLRAARRRFRRRRAVAAIVVLGLIGGGVWFLRRNDETTTATGTIRFDPVDQASTDQRGGVPPAVEKSLVARLDRAVVVAPGTGEVASRIVLDAPVANLPAAPGTIAATLFRYNGTGQVVLVGPPGWLASACIQVSVMSPQLRAFDTAFAETKSGACGTDRVFGRVATIGCSDAKLSTIMLDLVIPEGSVTLAEGGEASVGAVRVALIGNNPAYERDNLTTQISVAQGTQVAVPTFGGAVGSTVNFDLSAATGAPLIGTCTLR